jgi:hypothetical protein
MKSHEKRHKDTSGIEEPRERKREPTNGDPAESVNAESHSHLAAAEDTSARISFLIDFSLAEGQIQGKITHRLTNKHTEFTGLDQTAITQFMKKYLSRLEKGVVKMSGREALPAIDVQDTEKEEREIPSNDIRTRSFSVIPAGTARPTEFLQQGQPFQLQWCFEPPESFVVRGEHLKYKVSICRKKLASGNRELLGEIEGDIDCTEALTACIHSEPLPAGTYRIEADAQFSLRSKKADWSSTCHNSNLIHVA